MNKSIHFIQLSLVIEALCFCYFCNSSCTNKKVENEATNTCNSVIIDSALFKSDIQPILAKHCSTSGCHSGANPKGNLNLEATVAYSQLLKPGSGYVDIVNPKQSVLYSSLVSKSNPMPPSGNLDQCTIDLIETWMKQGAKNN